MIGVKRRALFLDRDGVLNVDHHYVFRPDQFKVIEGVFDALHRAQALEYALIVVTNQSGIARGYFTQAQYFELEEYMRSVFAERGIVFDGIYHCPHHPGGNVAEFTITCECRKPRPGMIQQAAHEHDIDLSHSLLVGDKESDIAAATAAGMERSYLLETPHFTLKNIEFE